MVNGPAVDVFIENTQLVKTTCYDVRHEKTDLKARPSFFSYDTNFSQFDSADIIDYILEKSVSYQT